MIINNTTLFYTINMMKRSLLHRPLFTKLFTPAEPSLFPTTKHIISPATITREKRAFFLGRRGSRIGAVLVHNGQMS